MNGILEKAAQRNENEYVHIMEAEDEDIYMMKQSQKELIPEIKEWIIFKYTERRKQYKHWNEFHLYHRFAFLTVLFLFLHRLTSENIIDINAMELAEIFAPRLQSKQYLFDGVKDAEKEQKFKKTIKIMIYFSDSLYPELERVPWRLTTLIHEQGMEVFTFLSFNLFCFVFYRLL